MENPLVTLQEGTIAQACLFMAMELAEKKWLLGFSDGCQPMRHDSVRAGDTVGLMAAVAKAKARFKLAAPARVISCYEAGRDGFWLHRFLVEHGVQNLVVDSASIEVNRRARRAKTDRMDVQKLLALLRRHCAGERVWSVVRVPSVAEEDARRVHREVERLKRERTAHTNRIRALLVLHNVRVKQVGGARFERWLREGQERLPAQLLAEIGRERQRLDLVERQLLALAAERKVQFAADTRESRAMRHLAHLYGIGADGAWLLVREFFGWRCFSNRRELGAAAGLTGSPYASGTLVREQGISKAGNKRVRWLMIQLAWSWLRHQPHSALSVWFRSRFDQGARMRRVGIVALARKLLIELWRYLEQGVIPAGARLKAA
jgi:transposase